MTKQDVKRQQTDNPSLNRKRKGRKRRRRRTRREQTWRVSEPDEDRHTLSTADKANEFLGSAILPGNPRNDKVHIEMLDLSDVLLAFHLNVPPHYGLRMEDVLLLRNPLVRARIRARGTTERLRRYFIMPYNVSALGEREARESGRAKGRNKKREQEEPV